MAVQVTIRTNDGRIIHGINYTLSGASLPTNPVDLAAAMPGGMDYGVYHLHDTEGWAYIPALQINAITSIKPGAPT